MNERSSTTYFTMRLLTPRQGFGAGACVLTALSLACLAQNGTPSNGTFRPDKVYAVNPVNERPDANRQMEINSHRVQLQKFAAVNAERKRQMAEDSARLLQIAAELNRELATVGGSGPGAAAVAKAGMVEQLAHTVKEKMKLTVAAQ